MGLKRILTVSDTYEGKRHDKKIFEEDPLFLKIPPNSTGMGDSAYQGIKHPFLRMVVPNRSPPKRELSKSEKQVNKSISIFYPTDSGMTLNIPTNHF